LLLLQNWHFVPFLHNRVATPLFIFPLIRELPCLLYRTKLPFFLIFHSFLQDASTKNYTTNHCSLCYIQSICGHIKHVQLSLLKRQLKAARWEQTFVISTFLSVAISYFTVNENFPRCYYFLTFIQPFKGLEIVCRIKYGKFWLCLK
jgi:hypothetical protein